MTIQNNTSNSNAAPNRHYRIAVDGLGTKWSPEGSWVAIIQLVEDGQVTSDHELSGSRIGETTASLTLTAAVEALKSLVGVSERIIVSAALDHLPKGMNQWRVGWKARGWKTSNGTPVLYQPLWAELEALDQQLSVEWVHASKETCPLIARVKARHHTLAQGTALSCAA